MAETSIFPYYFHLQSSHLNSSFSSSNMSFSFEYFLSLIPLDFFKWCYLGCRCPSLNLPMLTLMLIKTTRELLHKLHLCPLELNLVFATRLDAWACHSLLCSEQSQASYSLLAILKPSCSKHIANFIQLHHIHFWASDSPSSSLHVSICCRSKVTYSSLSLHSSSAILISSLDSSPSMLFSSPIFTWILRLRMVADKITKLK